MEMIRTFHPVGQGAFYSEEFKHDDKVTFRVVYDCGCVWGKANQERGVSVVKRWIAVGKNTNPEFRINYLFISHFDYDHVSLVKVFLDEGVKIDWVILPLLNPTEKKFLINFQKEFLSRKELEALARLINEPERFLDAKVVKIRPVEGENLTTDRVFGAKDSDQGVQEIESGTRFLIANGRLDWQYIPCNHQNKKRSKELQEKLRKRFGDDFDADTLSEFPRLMNYWGKKGFRKLHDVYNEIDGNINENSMIVYSGPDNAFQLSSVTCCEEETNCESNSCSAERQQRCVLCKTPEDSKCRISSACIYTGDANLNLAKIETWYKRWWTNVGTIQVPHHGSRLSFAPGPFSDKGYCCPISCSDKCYYKHPHSCVTNALVHGGNLPVRVTESYGFAQHINFQMGVKICFEI